MTDYQQTIKLNGTIYNSRNLNKLQITDEPKDSWRNTIYDFLQNWFDDSDYILAQTSGSTGIPKQIQLKKTAMENSARMTNLYFQLDCSKTVLLCLPAAYIAGKMMLVRAFVGGFNLITIEPKANPFENLNTEIDFTAITPFQLIHSAEILKEKKIGKIIVGGSAVASKLEKLVETIPAELYETYGMTETCSHIALRRFNGNEKSDSFDILDGISIRQDERDCLVINAPNLVEKELFTNDIVEIINPKSFKWLGRSDSVINSGGVKIFPEQIEKQLSEIIEVNYFIWSQPDVELGQKVILIVESKKFTFEQEISLTNKLAKVLTKFEVPKKILYIQNFVYSESNKILREKTIQTV